MAIATKKSTKRKNVTSARTKSKSNSQETSTLHVIPFADEQALSSFQTIEINQIEPGDDRSAIDDLSHLMSSIADVGLLSPVCVVQDGKNRYRLVAGQRRITSCQQLGWTSIPAHIVSFGDRDDSRVSLLVELVSIDSNLLHRPLLELQVADLLQRRKVIYETLHPEVRWGGNRKQDPNIQISVPPVPAFIDDTATITGRSRSTVGEYLQIAKNIDPEVKDALRDTPIADRKMDLLALAKMAPEKQRETADVIVSQGIPTVTKAIQTILQEQREQDIRQRTQDCNPYEKIFLLTQIYVEELAKKEGLQVSTNFNMASDSEGWINVRLVKSDVQETGD